MPAIFALSSMATILIVPLVVAVLLVFFAIGRVQLAWSPCATATRTRSARSTFS